MADDLRTFYELVKRTRAGVLNWLEALPSDVFNAERDDFAYGSLNRIFSHIADCYMVWLRRGGIGGEFEWVKVEDAQGLRAAFDRVDALADQALRTFERWDEPFVHTYPDGWEDTLTQRWLILHPITHEFHHKGQALALARVLGHPHPGSPDTDLVQPLPS